MIDLLRDPAWQGVGGIAAVLTFVLAVVVDWPKIRLAFAKRNQNIKYRPSGVARLLIAVSLLIVILFAVLAVIGYVPQWHIVKATVSTSSGNEYELSNEAVTSIPIHNCYANPLSIRVVAAPDSLLSRCCKTRLRWILQQNGRKQEKLTPGVNDKTDASTLIYSDTVSLEGVLTQENNQTIALELFVEAHTWNQRWVNLLDKPKKATIDCTYQGG